MNIEKWIIAHFSPTGGTKKVADVFLTMITQMLNQNAAGYKEPATFL